ncbi:MAG: hypothetical protein J6O71_03500 [Lachnospiraceae bacterium]|nr:hypothetical protein [Lachnospiraceae bacterium]
MARLYILELIMPIVMLLSWTVVSMLIVLYVSNNGMYPSGTDVMYDIYRGDFLYKNWQDGIIFPLYDPYWFNGIELLRVEPPLAPYIIALCQLLMRGNIYIGYLLYIVIVFIIGSACWYIVGMRENRPILGWFMGIIWFFIPNNLYILFGVGDLGRALANAFLPLFLFYVSNYLMYGSWRIIPKLIAVYTLITLSSLNYSAMIFLASLLYMIIYLIANRTGRRFRRLLAALCLPYAIIGLWLYNAYQTGVIDFGAGEEIENHFQSIFISLNPFYRSAVSSDIYYYGLAIFLVSIFGIICSKRMQIPGFITAIMMLLFSTNLLFPLLSVMPSSKFLLMLKYISIAVGLSLLSLVQWRTLKKKLLFVCLFLLILDTLPSLWYIRGYANSTDPRDRYEKIMDETLIRQAKEVTKQRLAFFDGGELGSTVAFMISDYGDRIMTSYGYGWEGAATKRNISQIEIALRDGYYPYLFDRMLQLGNDSVIIKKTTLEAELYGNDREYFRLKDSAEALGYSVYAENEEYIFFHQDIEGRWGTSEKFRALGIGNAAATLSLAYPTIEETEETNLNHYTYDELAKYDVIYLSEFTYDSLTEAENLVKRLADSGTQILILADGIPENRENRMKTFLGMTCNMIKFKNGYPELETVDYGVLDCDLFPMSYADWTCYYVNGLDKVLGTLTDAGEQISFYGTVYNDNIRVLALNIPLYFYLTEDPSIAKIMHDAMIIEPGQMPERHIVPMKTAYYPTGMTIECEEEVNTGMGLMDCFVSDRPMTSKNCLMGIEAGKMVIEYKYPNLWKGLGLTLLGVLLSVLYSLYLYRRSKDSRN